MKAKTVSNTRIISLLSDFGLDDEYVGVMKGVILSRCPTVQIVDLCHTVEPQNIEQAAAMLEASYQYFPKNTVHLAVVDPGVGTDRKILLAVADDQFFIGPDNGILTPLLLAQTLEKCFRLPLPETAGHTFHGRDIMAPAAAQLACGMNPSELGDEISVQECKTLPFPAPSILENSIIGEITHVDHFGNLITSISRKHLVSSNNKVVIEIGNTSIEGIHKTYGNVAENSLVAIINSRGKLEISVNMASAQQKLGCQVGDEVILRTLPQ